MKDYVFELTLEMRMFISSSYRFFRATNIDEMCNFGINFKYPTGDPSYPKAMVHIQDAQNSSWCSDTVVGTRVLCEKSHPPTPRKFNM